MGLCIYTYVHHSACGHSLPSLDQIHPRPNDQTQPKNKEAKTYDRIMDAFAEYGVIGNDDGSAAPDIVVGGGGGAIGSIWWLVGWVTDVETLDTHTFTSIPRTSTL